jgi:EmrB/QacA subfamily drug resistance transporter
MSPCPTLGRDFSTSISTIQWVPTIYLLAFASVIPVSGWASERFGAKRVWLVSLAAFMLGSLLCGLSGSVGELIGFRVLQGLGGGMIMPVGQAILAQAAGPQRMGRVMSIVGVPLLLGPIIGPVIGGAIVGSASWRWIFFVNLPVGAVALALALWLLPAVPARRRVRLDARGLVLLSGGIAVFLYGLAEAGSRRSLTGAVPLTAIAGGLTLVGAFCAYALRAAHPLIDIRLFARRGFATAAVTNLLLGIALFGAALLLPLYFEIVRGRTPLETGLLLIPQGLGAALAMPVAGEPHRPDRCPSGGDHRGHDGPAGYRRLHPDHGRHLILVPGWRAAADRRRARVDHHAVNGGRLPGDRARGYPGSH